MERRTTGAMAERDEVCGCEGREQRWGRGCGHRGRGAEVSVPVRRRTRIGQECRRRGAHGQDRTVVAKVDTDRTGLSAWRRTRTGQKCWCGGGHGHNTSVSAEAATDRTEASVRRRTRTEQECRHGGGHEQDRTDDKLTVSKQKLILEEKKRQKTKEKRTCEYIQDATRPPRLSNNNNPTRIVRALLLYTITGNQSIPRSEIQ